MDGHGSDVRNEPVMDIGQSIIATIHPARLRAAAAADEIARYQRPRSVILRENVIKAGVPDVTATWRTRSAPRGVGVAIEQRYPGHSTGRPHRGDAIPAPMPGAMWTCRR
jgi:hypothetical protein